MGVENDGQRIVQDGGHLTRRANGGVARQAGRAHHSVHHFDLATGRITKPETHQGYGADGCWTRGQAWGVCGFAAAYVATRDERFLEVADRASTYCFQRCHDDLVPPYCFDDPARPEVPRDSSAAAITCAALTMLAQHAKDPIIRQRSAERATALLSAMLNGYLTPTREGDPRPRGMPLQGCYNKRAGWDTDDEVIWGDYYLLESLRAWARLR